MAGHIYLTTHSCETLLEALVRTTDGQMIIAYHRYDPPCASESFILHHVLDSEERALFEHLIGIAGPLEDTNKPYLT